MGQPRVFPLADKALGGTLERRLRKERAAGMTFADIARELAADGITVSGETVRKWCRELSIDTRRGCRELSIDTRRAPEQVA